jgi:hypothetical protein
MLSPRAVPRVMEIPNTPTIDVTKNAFYIKPSTGVIRKDSAARKAKSRMVNDFEKVFERTGTPEQHALALATVLQKPEW